MESDSPTIERGRTYLNVPHNGGFVRFAFPSFRAANHRSLVKRVHEEGLAIPTGDEVASLFYSAHCVPEMRDEPEFKEIRGLMWQGGLFWNSNSNLLTKKGIYVFQGDISGNPLISIEELEERLINGHELQGGIRFSADGKVRFAPEEGFSYGCSIHTSKELAEQGNIVAEYGVEGAEKLREVSKRFECKPRTSTNYAKGPRPSAISLGGGNYKVPRLEFIGFPYKSSQSHTLGVVPSN